MPTPQELAMALRANQPNGMAGDQMAGQQAWQGGQMQNMGAMGNMGMNAMQQQNAMPQGQGMNGMNGQAAMQPMPQGAQIMPQPQVNTGLSPQEAAYLQSLGQ